MTPLLFLLLSVDTPQVDTLHYVCFSKSEAVAAADSALKGMMDSKRLRLTTAMFAAKANEASLLREAMRVDTLADRQMMVAYEARTNEAKSWEKAYIGQRAKGTKKTVLWTVIGILMGAYLKTVL